MITHLSVRGFKSLGNVEVDLAPLTVLIGRSGSGKSNLVDSIRFLRDVVAIGNLPEVVTAHGGWKRIASASTGSTIDVGVEFRVPDVIDVFRYRIVILMDAGGIRVMEEELSLGSAALFHHRKGTWAHEPAVQGPPMPHGVMLGALNGIQEVKIAHLALSQGIGCYDFPSNVLVGGTNVPAHSSSLKDRAENFLRAFDAISNDLTQLRRIKDMLAALQRVNASVQSVGLVFNGDDILVGHTMPDHRAFSFSLGQESEGFRRFFAHLLALYQAPPKLTLVFEEPEKGIYPGALGVLADYFAATVRSFSQIILTTHSPTFLDQFSIESVRVVEMRGYETKIGPVAPEQFEAVRENLLTTGELLSVDPARMNPTAA